MVETSDQVKDGGLTCSAPPDESNPFVGSDGEADPVKDRALVIIMIIAEANLVKFNLTFQMV